MELFLAVWEPFYCLSRLRVLALVRVFCSGQRHTGGGQQNLAVFRLGPPIPQIEPHSLHNCVDCRQQGIRASQEAKDGQAKKRRESGRQPEYSQAHGSADGSSGQSGAVSSERIYSCALRALLRVRLPTEYPTGKHKHIVSYKTMERLQSRPNPPPCVHKMASEKRAKVPPLPRQRQKAVPAGAMLGPCWNHVGPCCAMLHHAGTREKTTRQNGFLLLTTAEPGRPTSAARTSKT